MNENDLEANVIDPRYELQLSESRNAVWVHDGIDGSTVGRFGRMGVDIHHSVAEQMAGAPECRVCTHGPVTQEDWHLFREKAFEFWGINVPYDAFNPAFFK